MRHDFARCYHGLMVRCLLSLALGACLAPPRARAQGGIRVGASSSPALDVTLRPMTLVDADGWLCAIDDRRDLYCSLRALPGRWPGPSISHSVDAFEKVPGLSDVVAVSGTNAYLCALDSRGGVNCWGSIWSEQRQRLWPKPIALAAAATRLVVAGRDACAVLQTGRVQCWGAYLNADNTNGRIHSVSERPLTVSQLEDVTQVGSHRDGFCALDTRGSVQCWGLTDPWHHPDAQPHRLPIDNVVALDGSCAIVGESREVLCWEPKDSEESESEPLSVHRVRGIKRVKQLGGLGEQAFALTDDGALYHWGVYHHGGVRDMGRKIQTRKYPVQFGYYAVPEFGRTMPTATWVHSSDTPKRVASRLKIRAVVASEQYTCVELESGEPYCEWLLGQAPFHLQEVWPRVRFDAADGR